MKKIAVLGFLFFLGLVSNGFSQDVTNRQILEKLEKLETKINGMDVRIARLEEGQKGLKEEIRMGQQNLQKQIEGLQKQIDDIRSLLYVILAGMFALVGFILWDRRTALAPAVKKIDLLEEREDRLEKALKEFAKKEPRLTEAFQHAGVL
ncbi:MAG: hypothetical protein V2A53_04230 [bacterium]